MKHIKTVFLFFFILFILKGNAQKLETLIDEALLNNPEIQKIDLQYKRVSEKLNEVNTIPNTEFGMGYFISEPETRTGAQRFKISAKQMLPWFGTITSRENYVGALADAKYVEIVIVKRKLMTSVSQSYYKLYANKAKQEILSENINLLKTYETMALTSVEVGKTPVVDVLRLQIRQNELQQVKDVLQQDFLAEQTTFNKLLNREDDIEVTFVDDLLLPNEDFETTKENLSLHPELLKFDKLFRTIEQSELLNQKESSPMIGFGLDYINVSERPDINFIDNGKDIIMPMISLSIPIFNKKYKSITKQNELEQQEILYQKKEKRNTLETLLNKALKERMSARISYNTAIKNIKQANNAKQILIKNYETGAIDFIDVLDLQELELKFQINQIESIVKYYVQSTIINYLSN
ncbi:MAG: TolC family protein [Bacteroidetes bacterium]|nr:TolC family protein [Bacteroidota bacterium]